METTPHRRAAMVLALCAGFILPMHAAGQDGTTQGAEQDQVSSERPDGERRELFETKLTPISEAEMRKRYNEQQRTRSEMERELRKIRAEYFRSIRNKQIRQTGITRLREYTEPVIYPSLIEIFARDGDDVRGAILDHLVDQQNDDADTVVAWTAIFDKDKRYRELAAERLKDRIAQAGGPTPRIKSVVAEGLRRTRDHEVAAAAHLAHTLQLAEAIPMLINTQVQAQRRRSGGETSLAWILVGQQQAYIADLTPVVGNSAVAFDPQLAVVTTGTVLRVIDAAVVTYHVDVHHALVGLTSELWGQSTAHLGYDGEAWARWYRQEFVPFWEARQAEEATAREAEQGAGSVEERRLRREPTEREHGGGGS